MPTRQFATRTYVHPSPRAQVALWLRNHPDATINDLSRALGQTSTRVAAEVEELVGLDAVAPSGRNDLGAMTYRFAGDDAVVASVDIGPHSQRYLLCDLNGHVLHRSSHTVDNEGDLVVRVDNFVHMLHDELTAAGIAASDLWAVTFAVPGTVGADGRVVDSPLVPNWSGVDLSARLSEALGCPVQLVNDGSLSAIAESLLGHGSLMRDFLNLCVGRRLCVRTVLDGRPFEGVNGLAGSVANWFGERIDTYGQVAWSSDTNGQRVVERALAGERDARAEVDEVVHGLADGIARMVLATNPEGIVLGGSIGSLLKPWKAELAEATRGRLGGIPSQLHIKVSGLGSESVIAGATVLGLEHATSALLGEPVGAPVPDAWGRLGRR